VNAVSVEDPIVADDRQVLYLSLRNQHPIEGISMFTWKPTRPDGVLK
jgi:hypothetical protein